MRVIRSCFTAVMVLSLALGGACGNDRGGSGATSDASYAAGAALQDISPLSGLPLKDQGSLSRRAIAVKVENDPKSRPQSGLDQAELIYEEMVEGEVTRFIALYLDSQAGEIGPVRSVRPTDIRVLQYFDPLLATSGGSPQVMRILRESPINYVAENDEYIYFYRSRDRREPHNLYTSSELMLQACRELGLEEYQWSGSVFNFGDTVAGQAATTIQVEYPGACRVDYSYDSSQSVYLRSVGGQLHLDKTTGAQLAPTTVIVQYVELENTGVKDMAGNVSPDAVVTGSGDAVVFSGGQVMAGTWLKESSSSRTVYQDSGGREISILPGQVWVHLIPKNLRLTFQ